MDYRAQQAIHEMKAIAQPKQLGPMVYDDTTREWWVITE
jgi:hypothetical protein